MSTTNTNVTVRVRLPDPIWRHVKAQAVLAGVPVSDFVALVLTKHVVDTPFPDPVTVAGFAAARTAIEEAFSDPAHSTERGPDQVDPTSS
jgi:hypothetical protein